MLLAVLALGTAGLESVSFSHQHLAGGDSLYHHHVFLGSHEHPSPTHPDHDDHDPDRGTPAPHHRDAQRRSATVSTALALAQPIGIAVLAAPGAKLVLARPAVAPAPVAQPLSRLTSPRAPPASLSLFQAF